MLRRRRTLWAAPILLLAVIGLPSTAADAATTSWVQLTVPHVSGNYERANAVVAPGPSDVWAIGYSIEFFAGATQFQTLAMHWDGTSVEVVPTPSPTSNSQLTSAAAVSSDNIFTVGYAYLGSQPQTLIEHWDGTSWSLVDSPNPGGAENILEGVAASSARDVWAVGARINTGHFYQVPMTLHYNGSTWTTVRAPNPHGCNGHSYLTSVVARSRTLAWATGWCESSAGERGYVLHWDGKVWSVEKIIPQSVAPSSETYGIAATGSNNIWVVGSYRRASTSDTVPLTYHYDGTKWARVPAPASAIVLAGASLSNKYGLWTVGAGNSSQPPFAGASAAKYVDSAWVDKVPTMIDFGRLNAVTTDPTGTVWAAGSQIREDDGDDGLVLLHR
jgi:hypothetical protein